MYGKRTETAIAAMSRLAEVWDGGKTRLSAADIAEHRGLQRPFVCKILTNLSQANLVTGSPGPGGGYSLARDPATISLYEVYSIFERQGETRTCASQGGECSENQPCLLHRKLSDLRGALDRVLHETTFEDFRREAEDRSEGDAESAAS